MKYIPRFFFLFLALLIAFIPSNISTMTHPSAFSPQDLGLPENMSEEEFNEMLQFFAQMEEELKKMSPEELAELERLGREELVKMGINPDTGEPLTTAPQPSAPTTPAIAQPSPQKKQEPVISQSSIARSEHMLHDAITLLELVRELSLSENPAAAALKTWREALGDLLFYLTTINKSVHHNRLATSEFSSLNIKLTQLTDGLKQYESFLKNISPLEEEDIYDPYDILGVKHTATQDDIEKKYIALSEKHDFKKLEESLRTQGLEEADIKRRLKKERLSFSLITDAYEKLHDQKTRAQIDREREAAHQQKNVSSTQLKNAVQQITALLSNAIFSQQLLQGLEDFLKIYEPTELAQKQAIQAAQEKRHQEQKAAAQLKAAKHTGGALEPRYAPTQAGIPPSPYAGGYAGGYPLGAPYQQPKEERYPAEAADQKKSKNEAKSAPSGAKGKKEAGEKKSSEKIEQPKEKKPKQTKKAAAVSLKELINSLEKDKKEFENVVQSYVPAETRNILQQTQELTQTDVASLSSFLNNAPLESLKKTTDELLKMLKDPETKITIQEMQRLQHFFMDTHFAQINETLAVFIDTMNHPKKSIWQSFAQNMTQITQLLNPRQEIEQREPRAEMYEQAAFPLAIAREQAALRQVSAPGPRELPMHGAPQPVNAEEPPPLTEEQLFEILNNWQLGQPDIQDQEPARDAQREEVPQNENNPLLFPEAHQ